MCTKIKRQQIKYIYMYIHIYIQIYISSYIYDPHLPTFQASYICLEGQNLKKFFDINYKYAFEALFKKKKKEKKKPKQAMAIMCIRDFSLEL